MPTIGSSRVTHGRKPRRYWSKPPGSWTRLGVTLNVEKTRIVHVTTRLRVPGVQDQARRRRLEAGLPSKIRSGVRQGDLYAYPREKSIEHFKEQIRRADPSQGSGEYTGADRPDQPGHPRLGPLLSARPTFASSLPNSIDGSCVASGRNDSNAGAVGAGNGSRSDNFTTRWTRTT